MSKSMKILAALALIVSLAACGSSPGSRAVSGGLLGAGAGAAVGSLSGNAGTGALVGGGLGAVGGAVTAR
ncbi:YMGG-like glycine zipper-containing protein [Falsiroseomonas sp. CW058]|uniref:YMGG-like glycine zipper-containing protein n=1 Tax=Falsiroseomonas sp. CW058 TaxID=3388664 RepID=UPI003D310E42